jgi:hypothetical protein
VSAANQLVNVMDFDGTRERLRADGHRVVGRETNWRGKRQFFISPQSAMGTLIQVWEGPGGPRAGGEQEERGEWLKCCVPYFSTLPER